MNTSMFPNNTRVLVVDDMKTMRLVIKKALTTLGFSDIAEADDGETAWPMIQEAAINGSPFQLILSDWNMPKMKGVDLLKLVRGQDNTKSVPFILVISDSESEQIKVAISLGVSQYVVKPFTAQVLGEKLASFTMKKAG